MIKKTVFLLYILICTISLKAQSGQIQAGSIIKGTNGKPAGIVFQYDAAAGTGYMVSLVDTQLPWGMIDINIPRADDYINSALAELDFSGLVNTAAIVSQGGTKTEYAARWCFELHAGGLTGWYLPSCGELHLLLSNRQIVNQALQKAGASPIANTWHWSSSEGDKDVSWNINMAGGDIYPADKNAIKRVRAIRKF
ncbi:MAG: hypothetical protein LBB84_02995 [Tannerellaceae bacterium]|jgi:hypothetical protein|nr:hypothetical protein [Tannerellaceae bacterium]